MPPLKKEKGPRGGSFFTPLVWRLDGEHVGVPVGDGVPPGALTGAS